MPPDAGADQPQGEPEARREGEAVPPAAPPATPTPVAEDEPEERSYTKERLIAESGAFLGKPAHVVAGAFHGERRKHLTIPQAREAIESFLQRAVE